MCAKKENLCKNRFNRTVKRNDYGRSEVELPFNNNVLKLGRSYDIAIRRVFIFRKTIAKEYLVKK